jgi:hypothetical protein
MAKKRSSIGIDKNYQAEWDYKTLNEAEKIKNDANRFKSVQGYAKEQIKMLGGIISKPAVSRSSSKKK